MTTIEDALRTAANARSEPELVELAAHPDPAVRNKIHENSAYHTPRVVEALVETGLEAMWKNWTVEPDDAMKTEEQNLEDTARCYDDQSILDRLAKARWEFALCVLRNEAAGGDLIHRVVTEYGLVPDEWIGEMLAGAHPNALPETLHWLADRTLERFPSDEPDPFGYHEGMCGPLDVMAAVVLNKATPEPIRGALESQLRSVLRLLVRSQGPLIKYDIEALEDIIKNHPNLCGDTAGRVRDTVKDLLGERSPGG